MSNISDIEDTIEACRLANIEWQKGFSIGTSDLTHEYGEMMASLLDDLELSLLGLEDKDYLCEMTLKYGGKVTDYQARLGTLTEDEFVDYVHCLGILGVLLEV